MLTEFKIPEVGENITSGTAVKIAVTVGQNVKKDQVLLELETDKATIDVPSSVAGVIKEILIKEGTKVNVGQVVIKIDTGATASAAPSPAAPTGSSSPAKPAATPQPQPAAAAAPRQESTSKGSPGGIIEFKIPEVGENITSGTAVKIAVTVGQSIKKDQVLLELETDKATIEVPSSVAGVVKEILIQQGTKVNVGQVVMKIEAGASAAGSSGASATPAQASAPITTAASSTVNPAPTVAATQPAAAVITQIIVTKEVAAAPSVRRLARELGLNVGEIPGSGPSGRISKDDVKAQAKKIITAGPVSAGVATPPLPDFAKYGEVERKAMNNIRKKTAEHLTHAWTAIPHVTQFDKADITNLEKLRKQHSTPERKLSITPFLMKVLAAALQKFPQFNTSVDMATGEIIYKKFINIGIAVDTPNGLVVPVIRDVAKKSILELSDELTTMAQKARDKKLTIEDMRGGTFTISNLGGIGGTMFTPIVNWPEVAILGVSRGQLEPKYNAAGELAPALMLPLSLSYDHRVIDGADGARFLRFVAEAVEQPFSMELGNQ